MEYILSICRLDESGPIQFEPLGRTYSIVKIGINDILNVSDLPDIMNGNRLFQSSMLMEEYNTFFYKHLKAFSQFFLMDFSKPSGIEMLNECTLSNAMDILSNAIKEMHYTYKLHEFTNFKDWTSDNVYRSRKVLENFLDICHLCASCYPNDWNKSNNNGIFDGFKILVRKSLI